MKTEKKTIILGLIAVYLILITVVPNIITGYKENNSYNPDFYYHATGANQLIENKFINLKDDNRQVYDDNKVGVYPPGFMTWLATVSLLTGLNVLYLPIILTIINWVIFLLLTYIIVSKYIKEKIYLLLSLVFCLMFISGSRFLGFSYLVPPVLGCFFIWGILIISHNDELDVRKRIIILTILISAIFTIHRPSSVVWIFIVIYFSIYGILFKNKKIIGLSLEYISASGFAAIISYVLYIREMIKNSSQGFFYNQITINESVFIVILAITFLISLTIYLIKYRHNNIELGIENNLNLKVILIIVLGTIIIFLIPQGIIKSLFTYITNSYSSIKISVIYTIWTDFFVKGEYSDLRYIYYIFFIGIISVIFYLPGIIKYKIKSFRFSIIFLPIALIFSVLVSYYFFNMRSERPERIYLYIVPFIILSCIVTVHELIKSTDKSKVKKILFYTFIILFILSISVASVAKAISLKPFFKNDEYNTLIWMRNNIDKKIYAQGALAQIGNAFGLNMGGIYSFNTANIKNIMKNNDLVYIINMKEISAFTIINYPLYIDSAIYYKYDKIYSTEQQEILKVK
jgi:hypothetical protein